MCTFQEGQTGLVKRSVESAFANFKIENIDVAQTMWTNGNMNCIIVSHMNPILNPAFVIFYSIVLQTENSKRDPT
jgi:hypothetical protein